MHEALARIVSSGSEHDASPGLRGLRLQVALDDPWLQLFQQFGW